VAFGKKGRSVYEFGPFRLDSSERLLLRGSQPVQLAPKVFDTLSALLERAYEERSCWLSRLRVDPIFDSLRPAPGFDIVLKRAGGIH
jgi:hypothetical protein